MFTHAITRRPGEDFAHGLTTAGLGEPSLTTALIQHEGYVAALQEAGLTVRTLDPLPGHPDACFVEDGAVVVPEIAVITRPGASQRRGETATLASVLGDLRKLGAIEAPGTLDGGDVLIVDRQVLVGISARTNQEGARQLLQLLAPFDYSGEAVEVGQSLHLKSSVNDLGGGGLLVSPELAGNPALASWRLIKGDPAEAYACNVLRLPDRLLLPAGFPKTTAKLAGLDVPLMELPMSEFQKMDGGLTCLSLRL